MDSTIQRATLLWGLFVGGAGCSIGSEGPPDLTPHLGIVEADMAKVNVAGASGVDAREAALVVPAEVERGTPFTVRAATLRQNGCWVPGPYVADIGDSLVVIVIYDFRTDAKVCPPDFSWTTRNITLRFNHNGEATIRLIGRRVAGLDLEGGDLLVLEQTVVVR